MTDLVIAVTGLIHVFFMRFNEKVILNLFELIQNCTGRILLIHKCIQNSSVI